MPQTLSSSSEILAHWNYESDLWRDFLEYESAIYKGSVRAAKHFFFIGLVTTLALFFLILKISFLVTDEWKSTILILKISFGCVIFAWIFAAGFLWIKRLKNWNRLNQEKGEVFISLNEININGNKYILTFKSYGLSILKIERTTVTASSGRNFEILKFYMVMNSIDPEGGYIRQEKFEFRIPIPFGKQAEAEMVMNRFHPLILSTDKMGK